MKTAATKPAAALCLTLLLAACGAGSPDTSNAQGGTSGSGGSSSTTRNPTWHQDIAPLVAEGCVGCHRDGGIGPFSLEQYAQAAPFSGYMAGQTVDRSMPPFLAATTDECQPRHGFKDDPRLSQDEIDLFQAWHDAKAPEGDPSTAAPLPQPPELALSGAEVTVEIPAPVTIEGPGDKFICFSLAPDLTPLQATGPVAELLAGRVLLDAVQVTPGNPAIVHHVLVYTDEAGESAKLAGDKGYYDCFGGPMVSEPSLVMAWAPGAMPIRAPEKVAMSLPTTGRLVMQVHYHPTGTPQTDSSTSLQLRGYRDGIPEYIGTLALLGNDPSQSANGMGLQPGPGDAGAEAEFKIPAGAQGHTETMLFELPKDSPEYRLWAVGSHLHYVGTDMRIGISRPEGGSEPAEECLLQTPEWDFNWQRAYLYDTPIDTAPKAGPGDVLNLRCTYDNSMQNPFVSEALLEQGITEPRDVGLGEETLDEMCLGIFGIAQKVSDLLK